jgi:hypothetical protein
MGMGPALEALRSEAGEAMVLQNNYFIEEILPRSKNLSSVLAPLSGLIVAEAAIRFRGVFNSKLFGGYSATQE